MQRPSSSEKPVLQSHDKRRAGAPNMWSSLGATAIHNTIHSQRSLMLTLATAQCPNTSPLGHHCLYARTNCHQRVGTAGPSAFSCSSTPPKQSHHKQREIRISTQPNQRSAERQDLEVRQDQVHLPGKTETRNQILSVFRGSETVGPMCGCCKWNPVTHVIDIHAW